MSDETNQRLPRMTKQQRAQFLTNKNLAHAARFFWCDGAFMLTRSDWLKLFNRTRERCIRMALGSFGKPDEVDNSAIRQPAYPGDFPLPDDRIVVHPIKIQIELDRVLGRISEDEARVRLVTHLRDSYPVVLELEFRSKQDSDMWRTFRGLPVGPDATLKVARFPIPGMNCSVWMFRDEADRTKLLNLTYGA